MANFRNRPHLENRQMVQHSGAILNLSGQTVFEQGLYDTYFYNSYDDFLNGISGGTGYLNLIATSGSSTDAVSGYSEHISYQPGKLVLKPARGVIFSGNTNIVSGYTSPIDVTGYIATSIDSDGTVVWSSLSAITSGTCIPSFSVQTITPCSSGGTVTVDGNFTVEGNFTVIGTTTSATTIIETETVRVEDNNIELNYGGNHTTAIGGGITVLSGVSNSQNSRIYTLSDGTFMFEPGISATTIPYIYTSDPTSTDSIVTQTGGNIITDSVEYGLISNGQYNILSGTSTNSTIVGGYQNTIGDTFENNTIIGGVFNYINGSASYTASIVGGEQNDATDVRFGVIVGGTQNTMDNNFRSAIVGGQSNSVDSDNAGIFVGGENTIDSTSQRGAIVAGEKNNMTSSSHLNVIAGGWYNTFNGNSTEGFIGGGSGNTIDGTSDRSTILAGIGNVINSTSNNSGIVGGSYNTIDGSDRVVILGGYQNTISGHLDSAILGGSGNVLNGDYSVILGGQNITGTTNNTVYVPNLNIGTVGAGTSINNLGIDASGNVVVGSAGGTISGSGTTNQITYWDSTSSITSDTGFTWDGSTMKITKNSTVGGIIIDTSGDPSPASFSDKYQAAFILTESSNNDYDPTDLNSTLNTLSIGTVGSGFQTQGKIGPGIAFTFADDNSTGGANAAIRMVKSDTDIFGQTEDGALLVFGTREADNGGGGADVKESIRIGHNQYVGINYTPDNSTNPGAMLTLGTNAGDDATLAIREISGTPAQITNYGQFYVKSSDSKPYFKDSSGTEYDISTGTGGGVTIDPYNDLGNVNTTQTWDVSGTSTNYELTLTGSVTLNLNNVRNGDYGTLIVEQDGVGSHTLAFGTVNGGAGTHKVVNGGGGSPTLTSTPNAIDLLSFTYNGTTMYWSVGNDYT